MFHAGCGITVMNISQCITTYDNVTKVTTRYLGEPLEVAVELYLIGLMCLVGIFGNLVTIVVLCRDKERREALLLLQALAVADGLYSLVAILRYPLKHLLPDYRSYVLMQPVVFPMLKTLQTITIWTIVLVTIDRYIYVCKPFYAPQMFNKRTQRRAAVCIFILGFLYNLPRFFESCLVEWFNPCNNTTISRSIISPQFNHPLYYDIYQQGAYIVLLYILPLAILSYVNARLVHAIRVSRRRHRDSTTTPEYSENNATLVLVIIVVVFIICETPELFLRIATVVERKVKAVTFSKAFSEGLIRFNIVSQFLMVINSSINFFVYVIFGRRFRSVMKETFTVRFPTSVTHVSHETVPLQRNPLHLIRANILRKKQVEKYAHPMNNQFNHR